MPRPNGNRTIDAEDRLAERIARERLARNWSYDKLAREMVEIGCAIQPSAIYKIEKGSPRRRITVNEMAALSAIWAIPMDRLLS